MRPIASRALAIVLFLAACGPRPDRPGGADAAGAADSAPGGAAPAPRAATLDLQGRPMVAPMTAHVDSLSAKPAMLHADMAAHTAMTEHFVAATKADAAALAAPGSAAYDALADSVLADLRTLATAKGAGWDSLATAHLDRVHRLMAAYDVMVQGR
jgi:hypothetical protein